MEDWRRNLIEDDEERLLGLLRSAHRVAVLGIKTEAAHGQPAFYVPQALQQMGLQIVPVPVYYPEATQIAQLADTDSLWLEAAISPEQALAAIRTAVQVTALPVVITCALRSAPLDELRAAGAVAAGYACSPWPLDPSGADVAKPAADGLGPEEWARRAPRVRLLGGCCGTDERYLAALRATAR